MKVSKIHWLAAVAVVGLLVPATVFAASPLPPLTTLYNPDPLYVPAPPGPFYTVPPALPAYLAGPTVASLVSPITSLPPAPPNFGGTVTSLVFANGLVLGGPHGSSLTFAYVINMSASGPGLDVIRATVDSFWNWVNISDAGADGSGVSGAIDASPGGAEWFDGDPASLFRSGNILGGIDFNFRIGNIGTTLGPGETSALIYLETTNVFTVGLGNMGVIDSGEVGSAPILTVPVPGAALLGGIGLGLVGWLRRRFS